MVSARSPKVVGTEELKLADWYMRDSREDAHCIFPPSVSNDSSISSEVLELVDWICMSVSIPNETFTQAYFEGQSIHDMANAP